jgi:GTPase SAR1 family protein
MGICQSEDQKRSKELDRMLFSDSKRSNEVFKLLLLGTGESGKSTIFKQLLCLYGLGFSREYRLGAIASIHNQMLKTMKMIINFTDQCDVKISEDVLVSKDYVQKLDDSDLLTQEAAWHMGKLWSDPAIQNMVKKRVFSIECKNESEGSSAPLNFYLPDSTEYFFKQLVTISDPAYIPSNADLFRVRIPTTGILQTQFTVRKAHFLLVDVGGQRSERRKWLNCFQSVRAILYVVAISEYDQQLYEERRVNRIQESLQVFSSIATEFFPKTPIIIFFNKIDIFREKIKEVKIKPYYPDYTGQEGDSEAILTHFRKLFTTCANPEKKELSSVDRQLYFQVTCATDTRAAKKVFDVVRETVVREYLKQSSLISD